MTAIALTRKNKPSRCRREPWRKPHPCLQAGRNSKSLDLQLAHILFPPWRQLVLPCGQFGLPYTPAFKVSGESSSQGRLLNRQGSSSWSTKLLGGGEIRSNVVCHFLAVFNHIICNLAYPDLSEPALARPLSRKIRLRSLPVEVLGRSSERANSIILGYL